MTRATLKSPFTPPRWLLGCAALGAVSWACAASRAATPPAPTLEDVLNKSLSSVVLVVAGAAG